MRVDRTIAGDRHYCSIRGEIDAGHTKDLALNGTAVVYRSDPAATQLSGWKNWVIDLDAFGVNLADVNSITIGIGTKDAPSPSGGTATIYFDDIRLYR